MESEFFTSLFRNNEKEIETLLSKSIVGNIKVRLYPTWKTLEICCEQSGYEGNANVLSLFKNLQNFGYEINGVKYVNFHNSVLYSKTHVDISNCKVRRDVVIIFHDLAFSSYFETVEKGQEFFDKLLKRLALFVSNSTVSKLVANPNLP